MSRVLLLSSLVLWMCPRDNVADPQWASAGVRVGVLAGVDVGLVLLMSLWGGLVARRGGGGGRGGGGYLGRTLDRYNGGTERARYLVRAWFAVGLFGLGWGHVVTSWLPFGEPYRTPGLLVGTLPAFLAWMGLWWA